MVGQRSLAPLIGVRVPTPQQIMEAKNTEAAFKWIVALLNKHNIHFQISGGLAARLYGSKRELADIDIVMEEGKFGDLYPDVKEFVTFGPAHYRGDSWDLKLLTLVYEGQEIDIGGAESMQIFDSIQNVWVELPKDITNSKDIEVYGLTVPVISKENLIAYKKKLMREVDIADLKALEVQI